METNTATVTKEYGGFNSKKAAMARFAVLTMKGAFCQGRTMTVDGKAMVCTSVTAFRELDADEWTAKATFRPATEEEAHNLQIAQLQKKLDKCVSAYSSDPDDRWAIANRAEIARLEAEIAALKAGK